MGRYLEVSRDIASQVSSGVLGAGDDVPSIRESARTHGTTASTVNRAYRHLADAGVIEAHDRRRARVAAHGVAAARRLLGGPPVLRLAGSDDPALDIALAQAAGSVVTTGSRGSLHGLSALWNGTADAAAVHLRHTSGTYNAPFARALLRGRRPALVHLWRREQGLLVPAGNPGNIRGPADLRGLRLAKRPAGTGTRVLLDRLLIQAGVPADPAGGPEASSHLEVALCVASGAADAGLGIRAVATALDLGFVPLVWEDFDLVLAEEALAAAEPLVAALSEPATRASLAGLDGYDMSRTGAVETLA
jgi:molybdate-binding protein